VPATYATPNDGPTAEAIFEKIKSYVVASIPRLYDEKEEPEELLEVLQLPTIILPRASISDVRAHSREQVMSIRNAPNYHSMNPPCFPLCIVIDDEALPTIIAGPEPILKIKKDSDYLSVTKAERAVFVKVVDAAYTEGDKGIVMGTRSRISRPEDCIIWKGWMKVTPRALREVWELHQTQGISKLFETQDGIYDYNDIAVPLRFREY
jgi:hypothetical protein